MTLSQVEPLYGYNYFFFFTATEEVFIILLWTGGINYYCVNKLVCLIPIGSSTGQVSVPHIPSLFPATDLTSVLDLAVRPGAVPSKEGRLATFDISGLKLSNPVLVSGTDGVGTKLKVTLMSAYVSSSYLFCRFYFWSFILLYWVKQPRNSSSGLNLYKSSGCK